MPRTHAASVVIPNWNGRDLLEKYVPSIVTALAAGHPDNELVVVDNASADGSAAFLRERFPQVRVIELPKNLGFGAGSNAGFREAKNDIVVLLNSDMEVAPGFLQPLLDGFTDDQVFAVSCQIFFPDPKKHREETGLTQGWWENGGLRVTHRSDPLVNRIFPCFYPGGGSGAYDRAKFLELGGFDELFHPFYVEDTDLGMMAWKRGWKVLYQPASHVWHQHRATIGKKFSRQFIDSVVQKNFLLFSWKNIHETSRIAGHIALSWANAVLSVFFGHSMERPGVLAWAKAFLQLPGALAARWRARSLAAIGDTEAFRRPMGGYFHDRFSTSLDNPCPDPPHVLFISPYAIYPPSHGGGVFMTQTCRELARLCALHLAVMVDEEREIAPHEGLTKDCASAAFYLRPQRVVHTFGALEPHAVHEFRMPDIEWMIHREIYLRQADIVQYEYIQTAQHRGEYRRIAQFLFQHDVYFQSVGRQLPHMRGAITKAAARYEYLRALRYELRQMPLFDRVQFCSTTNSRFVFEYAPALRAKSDDGLRSGVTAADYPFVGEEGRLPMTMLFVGSFRHSPNVDALYWFVNHCMPRILEKQPGARLIVIGSAPPPRYSLPDFGDSIDLQGYVDDVIGAFGRYAVFVCPILSGSGIRVKLLEAFACGIPVVSTRVGAEGLAETDGEFCRLADNPAAFSDAVLQLLEDRTEAAALARRARTEIDSHWDMAARTRKLLESYRATLAAKRAPRTGG
jgi:GT2 family glycosyltransferase